MVEQKGDRLYGEVDVRNIIMGSGESPVFS
jgi:hypothetical protein